MEFLAITGGVASIAQLIDIAVKSGSAVVGLIGKLQHVPVQLQKYQSTLRSIQSKLQALQLFFNTLPEDISIPPHLWQEFHTNLLELQKDVRTASNSIEPYDSGKKKVASMKEKFQFYIFDQKEFANSMKSLQISNENLERLQSTIHLALSNSIYGKIGEMTLKLHEIQKIIPGPYHSIKKCCTRKKRHTLLPADSFLRYLGFFSFLIHEVEEIECISQMSMCIGVCISVWFALLSVSLKISMTNGPRQHGLNLGLNIKVQNRVSLQSPLIQACQRGDIPLIGQILNDGSGGINDRTVCLGKTPLLVAIDEGYHEVVKFLLINGADPNIADDNQVTPLFAAAGMNPLRDDHYDQFPPTSELWLDTFRLLVRGGASPHEIVRGRHIAGLNIVRGNQESQALEYLRLLAAEDVLQFDIACGHQCWSALQNALRSRSDTADALELLYCSGVDLSKIMADGRTALHLAAEWCSSFEPLKYLYSHGCQELVNKQDQWGWSALHYAALARNSAESLTPFSKVISLLRKGTDAKLEGSRNPRNHYDQPDGTFTAYQALRYARPARFELLMQVLSGTAIDVDPVAYEDVFHDAHEI